MEKAAFESAPICLTIAMTQSEPLLLLRRLVVLYKGIAVYDEQFHEGVNIIRGNNSTGKSTIVDFIFFALGGDFVGWKPEADLCESVLAEVEINQTVVTLRRGITKLRMQPMDVFWGNIDEALAAPFTGWQVFPFRRSDNKESFSQMLFRLLNFPQVPGETSSNITMHQVLRLVCVDQLSNVLSIFRDEQFDTPLTRKTVGELLYGIYDDQLYSDELHLRTVRRNLDRAIAEHDSLKGALSESGQPLDIESVIAQMKETEAQLSKIRSAITAKPEDNDTKPVSTQNAEFHAAQDALRQAKSKYAELANEYGALEWEIEDSKDFISNLERRAIALQESVAAEEALGRLTLQICPECLQPLDEKHADGHCFLCKKPVGESGRQKRMAKMKHELAAQIQESGRLLAEKQEIFAAKTEELHTAAQNAAALQRRFEDLTERARSPRDAAVDDMFIQRGLLEGRLESLEKQHKLASRLHELDQRITEAKHEVVNLEARIKQASSRQDARRIEAEQVVNNHAVALLRNDLPRQDEFKVAREVVVDFERNLCTVDKLFSFSASSITYLKSSVHFAIFFASLDLPFFRYPKFIANDNIEDKGMEAERSQHFQQLIVKQSQSTNVRHQIIFTTSNIAPEFNNTPLCVGPFYTFENKTLKFPKPNN